MLIHFRRSPWFTLNLIHLFIFILTCFDLFIVFIVFLLWLWHPMASYGSGLKAQTFQSSWQRIERPRPLERSARHGFHGVRGSRSDHTRPGHEKRNYGNYASCSNHLTDFVQIFLAKFLVECTDLFLSWQVYSSGRSHPGGAAVTQATARLWDINITDVIFLHVMFGDPNHARLEVSANSSDSSVLLTERGTSVLKVIKTLNLCTLFAVRDLQNLQDGCAEGVWLLWQSGWVAWLVSCQAPSFQECISNDSNLQS